MNIKKILQRIKMPSQAIYNLFFQIKAKLGGEAEVYCTKVKS